MPSLIFQVVVRFHQTVYSLLWQWGCLFDWGGGNVKKKKKKKQGISGFAQWIFWLENFKERCDVTHVYFFSQARYIILLEYLTFVDTMDRLLMDKACQTWLTLPWYYTVWKLGWTLEGDGGSSSELRVTLWLNPPSRDVEPSRSMLCCREHITGGREDRRVKWSKKRPRMTRLTEPPHSLVTALMFRWFLQGHRRLLTVCVRHQMPGLQMETQLWGRRSATGSPMIAHPRECSEDLDSRSLFSTSCDSRHGGNLGNLLKSSSGSVWLWPFTRPPIWGKPPLNGCAPSCPTNFILCTPTLS